MYGWDSYFIQLGLLRDGQTALAKDMTDNMLYQVQHYGKLLNANRSYYLERSQIPFLSDMVKNTYQALGAGGKSWLKQAVPIVEKEYTYWTTGPHLIPKLGLSRYYAYGEGPAPEVEQGEIDASGLNHYQRIEKHFATHTVADYNQGDYYRNGKLTPLFYKADRSMRESGFDPSNRFGPFNADILNYAPVCLNSVLYRTERNLADMYRELGQPQKAQAWQQKAEQRQQRMQQYLWDDKTGLFLDYNTQTGQRRNYPFATTFFPLWAGVATPQQARRVQQNLPQFEAPGGVRTSLHVSGNQWDAPFGWAPLQLVAIDGLKNYGFAQDGQRLAQKYTTMIAQEFERTGALYEKYNVETSSSDLKGSLKFGYPTNEKGFGWTNGVFQELASGLNSPNAGSALKPATPKPAVGLPLHFGSQQQEVLLPKGPQPTTAPQGPARLTLVG
jgi:alpha,alpha-trehalase